MVRISLRVTDDSDTTNNDALVHVVFRYCDLAVRSAGTSGLVPSEGTRSFAVSLRNAGTVACQVKVGSRSAYRLDGGKSTADRIPGAAPAGARVSARVRVPLRLSPRDDVDLTNNAATVTATVVGVGDSDIRDRSARRFSGRASAGRGAKLKASALRVARVEIAVLREGSKRCGWLTSERGSFSARKPLADGSCGSPRWLRASGSARWRFALKRALGAGRYTVYSRAVIGAGFPEARFSAADRNRIQYRIR
jgi:hypothetical protein